MLLFSAPGTGTNFVLRFMAAAGIKNRGLALSREQPEGSVQLHSHPTQFAVFEERVCPLTEAFPKVVIPLRHPYKAYRTHKRLKATHEVIIEHWQCLVEYSDKFEDVFYVPVDILKKGRLELMQELAEFIGYNNQEDIRAYAVAWAPVNAKEGAGFTGDTRDKHAAKKIPDLDFAMDWFDAQARTG